MTETIAYLIGMPIMAALFTCWLAGTAFVIGLLCWKARNQWSYE